MSIGIQTPHPTTGKDMHKLNPLKNSRITLRKELMEYRINVITKLTQICPSHSHFGTRFLLFLGKSSSKDENLRPFQYNLYCASNYINSWYYCASVIQGNSVPFVFDTYIKDIFLPSFFLLYFIGQSIWRTSFSVK